MRCDACNGMGWQKVEETNEWMDGWKGGGEGLSRVQGGVAKGDETDPTKLPTGEDETFA